MGWYMAVIVRGSFVEGALDEERLGDTLFKLIQAPDAESAFGRAIEMGEASADSYTDDDGNTVQFQYLGLADLREIDASIIGDGTEVYSELISRKPQEKVVEKRYLTVFETDDELESLDPVEIEEQDDSRFSKNSPIG
jgi:hypothetical protein